LWNKHNRGSSYEKVANIYRLRNLYLRNGLRSRSNTEPDFHPSWVNHLCRTSRRAIKQRRGRDRRTLHDGVHSNPRRQRLVRSQVRGLRRLSEARRPLASVARAAPGAAFADVRAKGRQRAAVARLGPARPGGRQAALILPVARERRLKSLVAAPRSDLPSWAPASRWSNPPLSDG
jgi:hypothetical protein